MKKYCRYCGNAVSTDSENIIWCEAKKDTRHKKNCITVNKCKNFLFCEIDVFGATGEEIYKPRQPRKKVADNQIRLEVENEN